MGYIVRHKVDEDRVGPQDKRPCKWKCGKDLKPAGKTQHEKFCKKRPDHAEVINKHRALFVRESQPAKESTSFDTRVEQVHELFHDDAALFSAVCHLLTAKAGVSTLTNLTAAKDMIDLKIKTLNK